MLNSPAQAVPTQAFTANREIVVEPSLGGGLHTPAYKGSFVVSPRDFQVRIFIVLPEREREREGEDWREGKLLLADRGLLIE